MTTVHDVADQISVARARVSRSATQSRLARERNEQGMTPAERLTLALELSDLCEKLATAGRRALQERS